MSERTKAILDGTWKSADTWDGMKEGTVVISPYSKDVPADVAKLADDIQAGWKDGSYDIFTGPIYDQDGTLRVKDGERMALADSPRSTGSSGCGKRRLTCQAERKRKGGSQDPPFSCRASGAFRQFIPKSME